ncbi:uncharacterized protein LOC121869628 [Homarus americanus]|uniref:uncharacterized protein LOC121869628 n=1 Tax=Homarus americanus TaxID=6706 RepID=UPI001C43F897|nr:uncharacterized protein LOC121869628 [Homarus americanus]
MMLRLEALMLGMLVAGVCLSQEVPGLANLEILRTAPRVRITGAVPDPDLPPLPSVHHSDLRRYDVMLDYDYDYAEESNDDRERVSKGLITTTLERPQSSETMLSTDVTDYAILSLDSEEDTHPQEPPALDVPLRLKNPLLFTPTNTWESSLITLERTPLGTVDQLPLGTVDQLPLGTVDQLPLGTVNQGPLDTADQLHLGTVERLPLDISDRPLQDISDQPILEIYDQPLLDISDQSVLDTSDQLGTAEHPLLDTAELPLMQNSGESTLYLRAVPAPVKAEDYLRSDGGQKQTLVSSPSVTRHQIPYSNTFVGGYYPEESYPMENGRIFSYPTGIYPSGSRAENNYQTARSLPGTRPLIYSSVDPNSYYLVEGSAVKRTRIGSRTGARRVEEARSGDPAHRYTTTLHRHATQNQNYYPSGAYNIGQPQPKYYITASQLTESDDPRYVRTTHDTLSRSRPVSPRSQTKAPTSPPHSSAKKTPILSTPEKRRANDSPTLRSLLANVDARSRDEAMYYTGLQREIEKSNVLLDAIKDVRTREGKSVNSGKVKQTTTTITPVPDIKEVKNKFGSHPLYDKLQRQSSLKVKPGPILHRDTYDDEEDEYENLYIPVRTKSLELEEIHEAREHFSTLVPKASSKPHPIPRQPTHQRHGRYRLPVTTYKPRYVPKFNKNVKYVTSPQPKSQHKLPSSPQGKSHRQPKSISPPLRSSKYLSQNTQSHRLPPVYTPHTSRSHTSSSSRGNLPSPISNTFSNSQNYNPLISRSQNLSINNNKGYSSSSSQRPLSSRQDPSLRYRNQGDSNSKSPNSPIYKYHRPSTHREQRSPSVRSHTTSGAEKTQSPTLGDPGSSSFRSHRVSSSASPPRLQRQTFPTPANSDEESRTHESHKRGYSRHPSSSLYEDSLILRLPEPEEKVRHKRGPDMEALFDANVKFPKHGYNIDEYFTGFPKFGFFDYDPEKEAS